MICFVLSVIHIIMWKLMKPQKGHVLKMASVFVRWVSFFYQTKSVIIKYSLEKMNLLKLHIIFFVIQKIQTPQTKEKNCTLHTPSFSSSAIIFFGWQFNHFFICSITLAVVWTHGYMYNNFMVNMQRIIIYLYTSAVVHIYPYE